MTLYQPSTNMNSAYRMFLLAMRSAISYDEC